MSDVHGEPLPLQSERPAPPSLLRRCESPAIVVALTVATALMAVTVALFGALGLRDRSAADEQVQALRERVALLEPCRRDLLDAQLTTRNRSDRASVELVIQVAEVFDMVIHGQAPPPDPLRPQINDARQALDDLDRALTAYTAACPDD